MFHIRFSAFIFNPTDLTLNVKNKQVQFKFLNNKKKYREKLFTPNKKPCFISSLTLHLNKKLCLYTTRRLTLILASWPAEGVNLIDEDDRWLVLPGKAKKIFHQPGEQTTDC